MRNPTLAGSSAVPVRRRVGLRILGCVLLGVAGLSAGTTQSRPRAGSRAAARTQKAKAAERQDSCNRTTACVVGGAFVAGGIAAYLGLPGTPVSTPEAAPPLFRTLDTALLLVRTQDRWLPGPDLTGTLQSLEAQSRSLDQLLGEAHSASDAECILVPKVEVRHVGHYLGELERQARILDQAAQMACAGGDEEDRRIVQAIGTLHTTLAGMLRQVATRCPGQTRTAPVEVNLEAFRDGWIQAHFPEDTPVRETNRARMKEALRLVEQVRTALDLAKHGPPAPRSETYRTPDEDPRD